MKSSDKIYQSGVLALGFFLLLNIWQPVGAYAQGNTKTNRTYKVTFIELGSVRCKPCIAMQPIIKSIESKYGSQVKVVFHDVWTPDGKEAAKQYTFNVIPTQLFFDENGKEYFRHQGYFPEDELIKVLQQKGVK
jgi:thioredoxin 1